MMRISIITASYNSCATIADCLQSVAAQSLVPEHLIIDGGSTDGTLDIVHSFPHVSRVVSEPDEGIYHAMNKGIALARGEIVGILNSDDFYAHPEVLSRVAGIFADPDVSACYGDLLYVAARDTTRVVRHWKSGDYRPSRFYRGWMPPHPTFFVRREVYRQHGVFNPEMGSAADYELMLRFLLRHGISSAYLPEILVKMRAGGVSNSSLVNRYRANMMDRKAWRINRLRPHPWTLYCKPLRKIGQFFVSGKALAEAGNSPCSPQPDLDQDPTSELS
jgi:glycosyltransferase involved in cell wall biosynthesis